MKPMGGGFGSEGRGGLLLVIEFCGPKKRAAVSSLVRAAFLLLLFKS